MHDIVSNIRIIEDLVSAFNRDDSEAAFGLMAKDILYHNIPMPPLRGIAAVRQFFLETGPMTDTDWRILHMAENGPVVMTERVDNMRVGGRQISLPVMGIFEIEKDRIKAWRDYFDLATFQRQLLG